MVHFFVLFCFLSLLACDTEEQLQPTLSGLENGGSCRHSETGSESCRSRHCLSFNQEAEFGVCSEICEDRCEHGGSCLGTELSDDFYCLLPCQANSDCDEHSRCVPFGDAQRCDEEGCEESSETFCVPS